MTSTDWLILGVGIVQLAIGFCLGVMWIVGRQRRAFEARAEARYRSMTGMDLPMAERARIAREHASRLKPTERTW